jgi:hypothetical protein
LFAGLTIRRRRGAAIDPGSRDRQSLIVDVPAGTDAIDATMLWKGNQTLTRDIIRFEIALAVDRRTLA